MWICFGGVIETLTGLNDKLIDFITLLYSVSQVFQSKKP